MEELTAEGFSNVYSMHGGILAWADAEIHWATKKEFTQLKHIQGREAGLYE